MSLEQKFAELKIDDINSVVETVKSEGIEKSGLGDNISILSARCGSSDDNEAIAALKTVKALAEGCIAAQAFTKECLGACKFMHLNVYFVLLHRYWMDFGWIAWIGSTHRVSERHLIL